MGRKREHFRPITVRVNKNHYKDIIRDMKRDGNVGNTLRRIIDEHYNYKKVFKLRIRNSLLGFYNLIYGGLTMNKKIIALIGIVMITGMLFGLGLQPLAFTTTLSEDRSIDGIISVHKNGILIDRHHNTLMNAGANGIRDCLTSGSCDAIKYIALGNGTDPAVGDTTLNGEQTECGDGFDRAEGTFGIQGTGNWSYVHTFTSAGCAGITLNTSAMFNASTAGAGTMFWGDDFTDTQLQVSDTLQITWNISCS